MRIGQPVVQGRKAHLAAIADEQKDKGRLEPGQGSLASVGHKPAKRIHIIGQHNRSRAVLGNAKGNREQNIAQQRQGNAHGTDNEILPGGLERTPVLVKIDQRRAGKRCRLDANPQDAKMRGSGNHAHCGKKEAQTGSEASFGRVCEGAAVMDAGSFLGLLLFPQITDGVK